MMYWLFLAYFQRETNQRCSLKGLFVKRLNFFVAVMVDFKCHGSAPSRRAATFVLLFVDHLGPIRKTIKSTVPAKEIGKKAVKVNRIPELETVSWNPYLKIVQLYL